MPSIYRPRRPRASPLWQVVHYCWSDFVGGYEQRHRPIHGPLRHDAVDVVRQFHRCGNLAVGFTRLQCPECGQERLLAFTCKTRHFCPSCHQRKVRSTGDWIARVLCFDVPHLNMTSLRDSYHWGQYGARYARSRLHSHSSRARR